MSGVRTALAGVARRLSRERWRQSGPKSYPSRKLVDDELSRILAKSFDDGTPEGQSAEASFTQLSVLVRGIISRRRLPFPLPYSMS